MEVEANAIEEEEVIGAITEAPTPEFPKLPEAVVVLSLVTATSLTITTSPSTLVILTSTVDVPKPLEFSKKIVRRSGG
jgi:hypothetical protein